MSEPVSDHALQSLIAHGTSPSDYTWEQAQCGLSELRRWREAFGWFFEQQDGEVYRTVGGVVRASIGENETCKFADGSSPFEAIEALRKKVCDEG